MSISESYSVPLSVRSETKDKFDALLKAAKTRKKRKGRSKSKEILVDDEESLTYESEAAEEIQKIEKSEAKQHDVLQENNALNENYILGKFLDENLSPEATANSRTALIKPPVPIPRKSKQNKISAEKPSPTPSQETFDVTSPKILKNIENETSNNISSGSNGSNASNRTYNVNKDNKIGDIVVHKSPHEQNDSEKIVTIIQSQSSFLEKGETETLSDNESEQPEDEEKDERDSNEKIGESIEMELNKEVGKNTIRYENEMDTFLKINADKREGKYNYEHTVQVIVHKTDKLLLNSMLVHPVVKIHIVDIETGKYFPKSDATRPVVFFYESDDCDYISPVMTHPFSLQDQRSIVPSWEEIILINEDYNYFHDQRQKLIIFFEILDFLPYSVMQQTNLMEGWHHVGFSFLKLSYNDALNGGKCLRLQLYYPTRKEIATSAVSLCPLWSYWKGQKLKKYPSTIYITIRRSMLSPSSMVDCLRSKTPVQRENGSRTIESLFTDEIMTKPSSPNEKQPAQNVGNDVKNTNFPTWTRKTNDVSAIPNKIYGKLECGEDGCFVMKFSNDGKHLACGVLSKNLYCIMIISVSSLKEIVRIPCHQNLIYAIKWSSDDSLIITASADKTISIIDLNSQSFLQILSHPSFVYCCDISLDQVIISGCCDKILRIWMRRKDNSKISYNLHQELESHRGYITTLCFNKKSNIFSADSTGFLIEWTKRNGNEWELLREMKILDLNETVINQIVLFSKDKRMLIHSRDSTCRIIDVKTCCVLQWLRGSVNKSVQTSCTLTHCGSYAFTGSEDGIVRGWNTKTGTEISTFKPYTSNKSFTIHCVECHPFDNIIAVSTYGHNLPVILLIHDNTAAEPRVELEREIQIKENKAEVNGLNLKCPQDLRKSFRNTEQNNDKCDLKSVLRKMDQVFLAQNIE